MQAVLSTYKFDSSMTLTLLQGFVTVVCLQVMKRLKYIDFPAFDWGTARKVAPLSFVFIAYVVISLISLGRVNVPMFTALRRVTVVFVMIEEYYLLGECRVVYSAVAPPLHTILTTEFSCVFHHVAHTGILPSRAVINSVGVMCLGAAIAAWKDLSFDIVRTYLIVVYIDRVRSCGRC